jgi:cobalt-zinc-cadmium resistance protein CzcA
MLRVAVDRQAVARYGVNVEQVLDVIEAVGGRSVGVVLEGQMRFALQVRFAPETRHDPDRIRDLRVAVPTPGGDGKRLIPLGQLADIRIEDGPAQISRDRVSRRINVEANVRGRDLGSFVAEAQKAVASEVELPAGWSLEWGGQFENLQEASRRLALLVPLALLLIFVLLYSAFGSVRLALLIYCNVPLAVTGGLLALALRGYPFSISAGVGFIALFGVAVLNGVVLVSYAVERQRDGVAAPQAALEAARVRLRPVLMTALVAALGFVPMALSGGAGAEVQRPLATVVIGGIVSTTLLTLLVLPSIYPWFSGSPADAAAVDRS